MFPGSCATGFVGRVKRFKALGHGAEDEPSSDSDDGTNAPAPLVRTTGSSVENLRFRTGNLGFLTRCQEFRASFTRSPQPTLRSRSHWTPQGPSVGFSVSGRLQHRPFRFFAIQTFLCGGSRLPFGSGAIPFRETLDCGIRSF